MKTTDYTASDAREVLACSLAEAVAAALREDLVEQARATLIVSGGSTPVPFFKALSRQHLDWARVDVTLADERWVGEDSQDSNTRLVKQDLIAQEASAAVFHPLVNQADSPEEGVSTLEAQMAQLSWPASVVVLGMGGDGHTASLFPDSPQLAYGLETDKLLLAVRSPSVPQARISFSASALSNARRHFLHVTGDEKRSVFADAFGGNDVKALPIRAFMSQALSLYWAP
ncbi:6-phosphogluconolactonase [Larsenimonas rhizosphaerae]|uniref:6-phosphogluconolactonase n=1 Tax=Larsenimonas rhizosphaerae TaxID=2944682 RepID=UPI002033B7C8|nr:6-phosphogluconolactonase [Larsenimonas rhizosphaerae]MCM2131745.1 6-phosphogluconolactonase [Larsenimonas rhizosphaerae]